MNAFALAVLLLLSQEATLESLLAKAREGAKDEELLRAVGSSTFKLSADDIVELKKAGVGERVIARMMEGPRELKVENRSHREVYVVVRDRTIEIGLAASGGIRPGATETLAASGEYAVVMNGRAMPWTIKTPASMIFRGADITAAEVVTFVVTQGSDETTHILEVRDKANEEPPRVIPPRGPPSGTRRVLRGGPLDQIVDGVSRLLGALAGCGF